MHFKKWNVIRTVVYRDVSTFSFGFLLHEFLLFLGSRVITILYENQQQQHRESDQNYPIHAGLRCVQ